MPLSGFFRFWRINGNMRGMPVAITGPCSLGCLAVSDNCGITCYLSNICGPESWLESCILPVNFATTLSHWCYNKNIRCGPKSIFLIYHSCKKNVLTGTTRSTMDDLFLNNPRFWQKTCWLMAMHLMMLLHGKLRNHQSHWDSSPGAHKCLYKVLWQSIQ